MDIFQMSTPFWYRLTLGAGTELFQALKEFFKREGLEEAYVLSCIGSLERAVLAYPKTHQIPPEIGNLVLEGVYEINGIQGNIKKAAGGIKVHLHGSLSKAGKEVYGGAIVAETRIFKIAELVIVGIKGVPQ